ncbi:MAG: hypothetical protein U5L76_04675 [Patescibacteria group bacterium]|nr:hypothetical protein [Patescibacteria group bacterium]
MKYFVGIIALIIGSLMLIKTEWFLNWTGRIPWAEEHLSAEGGTRMLIKILGLIVIIGTFLILTGILQGLLGKIFNISALG